LEIESILADACVNFADCPFSQEAHNEWVRFKIGPSDIALSDIEVIWPNNPWQGFAQDASTATLVAQMNATVQGCGWLMEPTSGTLPAGSSVLLVTSTFMCPTANPFSNLNDTLYVLFQAAGNSTAHFLNHNNGPDTVPAPIGPPVTRTLVISQVSAACHDTATYLPQQLLNIYGNYGGLSAENDGATVEFSWPGVPQTTYLNIGCQAPFTPLEVTIDPFTGSLCSNGIIQLSASITTPVAEIYWQGGSGVFSDPDSFVTTYSAGPADTVDVVLQFCAVGTCGDPVCTSVIVPAGEGPQVSILNGDSVAICAGDVVDLIAIGNGSFTWNTGENNDTLSVSSPGTYTVIIENTCGTAMASIEVVSGTAPIAQITGGGMICNGDTLVLIVSGGVDYLWNTGSTNASLEVYAAGEYWVIVSNGCGSDTAQVEIQAPVIAAFTTDIDSGIAPLEITFLNLSIPDDVEYSWDFGDGSSSTEDSPTHFYTSAGSYIVTLTATSGDCSSTATTTIIVVDSEGPDPVDGESSIEVPNVFTPNGDGRNDVLELSVFNITSVEMGLYNRWGQRIYLIEFPRQVWDGRSFSGESATEGTYFFELKALGGDGVQHELRGSVTLIR
jgi:gliding motility-associated-like protein